KACGTPRWRAIRVTTKSATPQQIAAAKPKRIPILEYGPCFYTRGRTRPLAHSIAQLRHHPLARCRPPAHPGRGRLPHTLSGARIAEAALRGRGFSCNCRGAARQTECGATK